MELVKKDKEWRYCCEHFKYTPPAEYGFITKDNVFVLDAQQSCVFLFKYRSLRKYKDIDI